MKVNFIDAWGTEQSINLAERDLWVIGSLSDAHLILKRDADRLLSRIQCNIRKVNEGWHIFDGCPMDPPTWASKSEKIPGARSNKGTFVNGKPVGKDGHNLQPQDIIHFVPVEKTGNISDSINLFEHSSKKFLYEGKVEQISPEIEFGDMVSIPQEIVKSGFSRIDQELEDYAAHQTEVESYSYYRLLREISLMESSSDAIKRMLAFVIENIKAAGFCGVYEYTNDRFNSIAAFNRSGPTKEPPSTSLLNQALEKGCFFIGAEGLSEANHTASISEIGLTSAIIVPYFTPSPGSHEPTVEGFLYIDNRKNPNQLDKNRDMQKATIISAIIHTILLGKKNITLEKRGKKMKWVLERFFSAPVAEDFLTRIDSDKDLNIGVDYKYASILFLDVAGFTETTAKMESAEVQQLIIPFFEFVDTKIHEHGGHGTKFIGDAVMAIFCQPLGVDQSISEKGDWADKALQAAVEIITNWPKMIKKQKLDKLPVRIGIHSGPVAVGNIGYEKRFEYTAFGKTVNLASRMEKYAEENGIAITEETYNKLGKESKKHNFTGPTEKDIKGIGMTNIYRLKEV